ncbi:hypothetical protein [uncultured Psychroserpens sp.]|uniref:hypothetical protein n=1 Tax=uncultured Psychroserpens sp. TaxID=255436 RepID=UPI0026118DC7|nr:hypothetical protein [uncultured Psychroserpens sp.]
MSALKIHTSAEFERTFNNYPVDVKPKLIELRKLIIETAKSIKDITVIEETLKWNKPSFISKIGSTIRIDWKEQSPNQYAIFNAQVDW